MTYSVKEIFYTLQGEGANTGSPAVFCRFSGCNLWSGREADRATAVCKFCDTDFVGTDGTGGGKFSTADALSEAVDSNWPQAASSKKLVVLTGGEPLLQLDGALVNALHARGFAIAVETNGTLDAPEGIDWICVSPKAGSSLKLNRADEIKVVWPQSGLDLEVLSTFQAKHHFLQPLDDPNAAQNRDACIEYCLSHPLWRLSLQTHKIMGIR